MWKNMAYALVVLSCKRFLKISGPDSCMMNVYTYRTALDRVFRSSLRARRINM